VLWLRFSSFWVLLHRHTVPTPKNAIFPLSTPVDFREPLLVSRRAVSEGNQLLQPPPPSFPRPSQPGCAPCSLEDSPSVFFFFLTRVGLFLEVLLVLDFSLFFPPIRAHFNYNFLFLPVLRRPSPPSSPTWCFLALYDLPCNARIYSLASFSLSSEVAMTTPTA